MQLDFSDFHAQGPSLWCKVGYVLSLEWRCNLIFLIFMFRGPHFGVKW